MQVLNANMTITQVKMYRHLSRSVGWGPIPDDVKSAFKDGIFKIIEIPAGTKMWKMSAYNYNGNKVSPWWAPVNPFMEDKIGVRGRLKEARFNGISAQHYVRIASAVRYDWNKLDQYQQISLKNPVKGLWGQFAPQPNISPDKLDEQLGELLKQCPHIPTILGGMGAWQFWIPNLTDQWVQHEISTENEPEWLKFLAILEQEMPAPYVWESSEWVEP